MAISSKDADDIRRLLNCPICLERQHTPRQLPCIHTFCQKCIQQFIDKRGDNGKFPCPRCKKRITVPTDGVAGFPFNHFVNHLNDCVQPKTDNVVCYVCHCKGSKVEAKTMCIQCAHHLCEKCSLIHCDTGVTLSHKVVSLDEVAAGEHFETIRQYQKSYCSQHPERLLEIYCDQCKIPLCLLCKALKHDQHPMETLEEAAQNAIAVMQDLLKPWEHAFDHAISLSKERKEVVEELSQEQMTKGIEEICEKFDSFKRNIEAKIATKKSEAITKFTKQFSQAKKLAQIAFEEAEASRLSIASTLRYVKKLIERAHAAEITQQYPDVASNLASLDHLRLEVQVDRHVFKTTPTQLHVPEVSVDTEVFVQSHNIAASLSRPVVSFELPSRPAAARPPVTAPSVSMSNFNTRPNEESGTNCRGCWGLSMGDLGFFVTDLDCQNVKVFDKENFSLKFVLNRDSNQHKLQDPVDVTSNKLGEIYVTDHGIRGVVKYNSKGHVMKIHPDMYKGVGFITCLNDQLIMADRDRGRLIFTDFDFNVLQEMNGRSFGLNHFKPRHLSVDNDTDYLVVLDQDPIHRVHVIDCRRYSIVKTFSDKLRDPQSVCVDQFGNVLVADKNRVILYDDATTHVLTGRDDVLFPTAICISAPGHMSVLERETGDVKTYRYLDV